MTSGQAVFLACLTFWLGFNCGREIDRPNVTPANILAFFSLMLAIIASSIISFGIFLVGVRGL